MKTNFEVGQVVRFKNYKRTATEKEAFFIVIIESSASQELALYVLNSNRIFKAGSTIIPEFPEEDLQVIQIKPSDLMQEEIIVHKVTDTQWLSGVPVYYYGNNAPIEFKNEGGFLISNNKFIFKSEKQDYIRMNLHVGMWLQAYEEP